jgi:hypothetical protein
LTLIMHCCPLPLHSSSSSQPGRRPRLAILAQVRLSPFIEQTRKRLLQHVCGRGVPACPFLRLQCIFRRHREKKSVRKKQESCE